MLRLLALALVLLSLAACRPLEGPAERYRQFTELARAGRVDEAWAMLS